MTGTATAPDPRPVYSEVMEDYAVISEALDVGEDEVLVAVASGGDNVWNAALDGGRHVFGVDVNPVQIDFCRLQEAAISTLAWREFAELQGVVEATAERRRELLDRLALTDSLASYQAPPAEPLLADSGLLACGHLSMFVAPLRENLCALVGPGNMAKILTEPAADERRRLWQQHFESPEVVGFLGAALNEETISDSFIPGWAFPRMAEKPFHLFYHRVLRHQLVDLDPTANPFMHRLWLARFPSEEAVPPYLEGKNYARLRERLKAVTWHTADVLDLLRTLPRDSVDAFNLSNVLDWSDDEHYVELWQEIDRVAASGARAFLRSFLAERPLPPAVAGAWSSDSERSSEMARSDRVGYYSRYELWTFRGTS